MVRSDVCSDCHDIQRNESSLSSENRLLCPQKSKTRYMRADRKILRRVINAATLLTFIDTLILYFYLFFLP